MKKFILLLSILLNVCFLEAQPSASAHVKNDPTAERIAKRAISQLKKSAYISRFDFVYYSAESEESEVSKGELTIDNLRFRVHMNGIETIYDGLTQWVYISENNEVTISEPSRDELVESNPMMMIEHYMSRHRINLDNEQLPDAHVVNFFPKDPKSCDFFKISFIIDNTTYLPRQMTMSLRTGDKITIKWNSFKPTEAEKSIFVFNTAEYPDIEINDMR